MSFDFPASPSEGQIFNAPGGPTYVFNTPVWKAVGQGQIAIISDTLPANPANGALWYESDSGVLFIWYNDGNSSQWVQVGGMVAPRIPIITDWVAYPAVPGNFGVTASVQAWSRRVGDTLQVRGRFSSGTPNASEARFTFGYNGVDQNVTASTSKCSNLDLAGHGTVTFATASGFMILREAGQKYFTFGLQNATFAGYTKAAANNVAQASSTIGLMAEVPIEGWTTYV